MFSTRLRNAVAILALCTGASVAYGIIHDQLTVRICLEYFTVFHPPIFGHQLPTVLALLWGTAATCWVGFLLGAALALASCWGPAPMRTARSLVAPITRLLLVMAASAAFAGVTGYTLVQSGTMQLARIVAEKLPPHMEARFVADASAHDASYIVGLLGGTVMVIQVWRSRIKGAPRKQEWR